jgi:hypothetical protein
LKISNSEIKEFVSRLNKIIILKLKKLDFELNKINN